MGEPDARPGAPGAQFHEHGLPHRPGGDGRDGAAVAAAVAGPVTAPSASARLCVQTPY
ncbi:hypothetical protein [Streptacidiphilus sp. EB129]|uniref:hypothetical protein n=1 Tax=Streptacidiphilus sp. EB129 TaxID=3156262 RepID=UPI003510E0EE